eukprot:3939224-Rhodomonas_salina.2
MAGALFGPEYRVRENVKSSRRQKDIDGQVNGPGHSDAPPQTPHSSTVLPLYGMPSQPAHVELSPPHSPHESTFRPLPCTPSQPTHDDPSPPQTPHTSSSVPLAGIPSQPAHVDPSPPHSPHASMSVRSVTTASLSTP